MLTFVLNKFLSIYHTLRWLYIYIYIYIYIIWQLEHVSRDSNKKAYALAAMATSLPIKEIVLLPVYYQPESSITARRVNEIDEAYPSWMNPIVRYLSSKELSDNRVEAHKTQVQAARFSLVNGQLYKWSLKGAIP